MQMTGKRRRGIAAGWPAMPMVAIAAIVAAGGLAVPTAIAQGTSPGGLGRGPEQPKASDPFGRASHTPIELWETADYLTQTNRTQMAAKYLEQFRQSRPIDLWASSDYLVRTGRAAKALPYLDQFLKGKPNDATLIAIRDKFGLDSFRRLGESPATRPYAQPLIAALTAADRRTQPVNHAPGPELFARDPRNPIELWEAADYLIRTGQARKAVPYLQRFLKAAPDDATYVAVRDRYGVGSFLRLDDDPATQPFARPLGEALAAATRRYATQPGRVAELIADLSKSPAEQGYALRRLWEAGPYAVPPLIEALHQPGLPREDHDLLLQNVGRLRSSAVAPLAAVLDGTDPSLATDAAIALGSIGDPGAVPFLTFTAASPAAAPAARAAAQDAIARLTGRPFAAQPLPPGRVLDDAAWSYHRGRSDFPDETTVLWSWDDVRKVPVAARGDARGGPRDARPALRAAGVAAQSERPLGAARAAQLGARAGGPPRRARGGGRAGRGDLRRGDRRRSGDAGPGDRRGDRRRQERPGDRRRAGAGEGHRPRRAGHRGRSAASAGPRPVGPRPSHPVRRRPRIVALAPDRPFPGSSLVAPTLARFAVNQSMPRAVVIDGNANRGALVASGLNGLGYLSSVEATGDAGFLAAASSADVELVLVAYDLHSGNWKLIDTLSNLLADARTRALPVYIYGPHEIRILRPNLERDFPGIRYLVPTDEPALLERQLRGRPSSLTAAERTGYARDAAALLARIAAARRSPMAEGLRQLEPALAGRPAGSRRRRIGRRGAGRAARPVRAAQPARPGAGPLATRRPAGRGGSPGHRQHPTIPFPARPRPGGPPGRRGE